MRQAGERHVTTMLMLTEVLSTLVVLVALMTFTYALHRDKCRRLEGQEQKFERFDTLEEKFERRFTALDGKIDAVHGRIDALVQPRLKLVRR